MGPIDELNQQVAELSQRLDATETVQAIHNLKARYAQLVDERYSRGKVAPEGKVTAAAEQIAALFTEDGVWDGGPALGVSRGRAAIRERFLTSTLRFAHHFFVKPRIEIGRGDARDTATGRWDILAPCTTEAGDPYWMAGVEEDEYEREDGVWKHSSMKLRVVFMSPYERGWVKAAKATRS